MMGQTFDLIKGSHHEDVNASSQEMLSFSSSLSDDCDPVEVMTNILDLPDEVLGLIFSHCNATQLIQDLSPVCKRFCHIIQDDTDVWKDTYYIHDFSDTCHNSMHQILSKCLKINCVRIEHPGGLSDIFLLDVVKDILSHHNNLQILELKCHQLATGYTNEFMMGLYEICGNTLRHLRMQGTLHRSAIIPALCNFSLTTLELSDTYNITGRDLRQLCDECHSLNWLSIPKASQIIDDDLVYFIQRKHHILLGLDVSGFRLTDKSLVSLSFAPKLFHLSIWDARNLQWKSMSTLKTLIKLRFLRLRRLRVGRLGVLSWLVGSRNVHQLQFLDLQYSYFLDENVLMIISFLCPNIKYLYWGGYISLSKHTHKVIRTNLPNLLQFSILPSIAHIFPSF